MFFVYVLENSEGKKYVGHTSNLDRRLQEHNETGKGYTSKYRPWRLVYHEKHPTRAEAMLREKFLKSGKGREFLKKVLKGD